MSYLTDISLRKFDQPLKLLSALLICACASLLQAQSTGPAKLVQMTGQVSVLRGSATWALNIGDSVQPQQVIITGPDGSATFQVSDGSTFEVFPNSKAVFRDTPGDWQNLLRMVLGRVRVEIQHLGGQPNHNNVRTATAVISVRGTIFDVTVEDDKGTTLVLVEEGRVAVQHLIQAGSIKYLEPGEWVEVFWNQPLASNKRDHGALLQQGAKALRDALYDYLMHTRQGPGTTVGTTAGGTAADKNGGSSGSTNSGSTSGNAPPPPPPAPPPPSH